MGEQPRNGHLPVPVPGLFTVATLGGCGVFSWTSWQAKVGRAAGGTERPAAIWNRSKLGEGSNKEAGEGYAPPRLWRQKRPPAVLAALSSGSLSSVARTFTQNESRTNGPEKQAEGLI